MLVDLAWSALSPLTDASSAFASSNGRSASHAGATAGASGRHAPGEGDVAGPSSGTIRLTGVPSTELQHIVAFAPGQYVIHGQWLGRVDDASLNLVLVFENGAACRVTQANLDKVTPVDRGDGGGYAEGSLQDESEAPYYPGEPVRVTTRTAQNAKWLNGAWNGRAEAVVAAVEPGHVTVQWIACGKFLGSNAGTDGSAHGHDSSSMEPPPERLPAKDLTTMTYYKHTCWNIGNHALVPKVMQPGSVARIFPQPTPPASADNAADGESPRAGDGTQSPRGGPAPGGRNRGRKRRKKPKKAGKPWEPPGLVAALVVGTHTEVDVQWQDGSISTQLAATDLVPVRHPGEHDFYPGEFVMELPGYGEEGESEDGHPPGAPLPPGSSPPHLGGAAPVPSAGGAPILGNRVPLADIAMPGGHGHSPSPSSPGYGGGGYRERRIGLIRSLDARQRTARVSWGVRGPGGVGPVVRWEDPPGELVSVYQLAAHEDFMFRQGDVVLRLPPATDNVWGGPQDDDYHDHGCHCMHHEQGGRSRGGTAATGGAIAAVGNGRPAAGNTNNHDKAGNGDGEGDDEDEGDEGGEGQRGVGGAGPSGAPAATGGGIPAGEDPLKWIGEVIGLADGRVNVMWADGTMSKMPPEELWNVSRDEEQDGFHSDGEGMDDDGDGGGSDASWETVDEDEGGGFGTTGGGRSARGPSRHNGGNDEDDDGEDYNGRGGLANAAAAAAALAMGGTAPGGGAAGWNAAEAVTQFHRIVLQGLLRASQQQQQLQHGGQHAQAREGQNSWDEAGSDAEVDATGGHNDAAAGGEEPSAGRAAAAGSSQGPFSSHGYPGPSGDRTGTSTVDPSGVASVVVDSVKGLASLVVGGIASRLFGGGAATAAVGGGSATVGAAPHAASSRASPSPARAHPGGALRSEKNEKVAGAGSGLLDVLGGSRQGAESPMYVRPVNLAGYDEPGFFPREGGGRGASAGIGEPGNEGESGRVDGDAVAAREGPGGTATSTSLAAGSAESPAAAAASVDKGGRGGSLEGGAQGSGQGALALPGGGSCTDASGTPGKGVAADASCGKEATGDAGSAVGPEMAASADALQGPSEPAPGSAALPSCLPCFACEESVTAEDCGHVYLDRSLPAGVVDRRFLRRMQKEWALLQSNLPDSIAVRCFQDRVDLLRAVVSGPAATPYHDGLYFFDIYFPSDYPTSPPEVYYHSGGLRINPNLYENGKVCLSLLNTWSGRGTEVWDASSSNILQVLISIQGLVLVSKPYYNEAGYEKHKGSQEGEKNAKQYNENTYLLCVRTMLNVLRNPPKPFEQLVSLHFKSKAGAILKRCDEYLQGRPVGSPDKPGGPSEGASAASSATAGEAGKEDTSSEGFRIMLSKLRPRLEAALKAL
eukprot:jgi/Mesvir1/28420/Mv15849-RA.2